MAVLDSGVAYEDYTDPRTGQAFRKAPDWGDTKFVPGYDFVNGDAHPNDDEYHGTHVASTIAEATNNGTGMAGLAFGCAIMPVKVLDQDGEGTFFDVAEGIDYAAEYSEGGTKPVKVINLSLGSEGFSQTVKTAIDRAVSGGVVVVAAAGNSGKSVVEFPANLANVLAVGALDAREERASYSNTGADLDFVAPGGNCDRDDNVDGIGDCVFQQMPDPDFVEQGRHDQFCYCGLDGTSMATPHVAAAAALLFSQGFTDGAAVRAALEQTAERLGRRAGRAAATTRTVRPRPARGGPAGARPQRRLEAVGEGQHDHPLQGPSRRLGPPRPRRASRHCRRVRDRGPGRLLPTGRLELRVRLLRLGGRGHLRRRPALHVLARARSSRPAPARSRRRASASSSPHPTPSSRSSASRSRSASPRSSPPSATASATGR